MKSRFHGPVIASTYIHVTVIIGNHCIFYRKENTIDTNLNGFRVPNKKRSNNIVIIRIMNKVKFTFNNCT